MRTWKITFPGRTEEEAKQSKCGCGKSTLQYLHFTHIPALHFPALSSKYVVFKKTLIIKTYFILPVMY